MTLLVAGHETTATALAWTLERLVRHPDVLARAARGAARPADDEYLDAVVKETLRLRPVVPGVVRQLQRPMTIGGMDAADGRAHRALDLPDPPPRRTSTPSRRRSAPSASSATTRPSTYEWLPFGGGIRRCLGASFALYEMRIVLQTILRRAALETTTEAAEQVRRRFVTFTPGRGGRIRLTALAPAAPAGSQAPVAA